MKNFRSAALMAAALGSIGGLAGIGYAGPGAGGTIATVATNGDNAQRSPATTGNQSGFASQMAAQLAFGRPFKTNTPRGSGPGWTNAHARRVARKARNVRRHRATMKRA